MKKVKKITPIKSETLCRKCKYGWSNHCKKNDVYCEICKMYIDERCVCPRIKVGQPCSYFERYKEEAQK